MSSSDIFAEARVGECRLCVVRADTEEHFLHDFFTYLHHEACRRRYRSEREHPEYVDLGGES